MQGGERAGRCFLLDVHSLTLRRDFIRVKREGKSSVFPAFVLVRASGQTSSTRVGYIVTKKIGCACVRNRIKRRLKSAFRETKMPKGDYIVIGRAVARTLPFKEIKGFLKLGAEVVS